MLGGFIPDSINQYWSGQQKSDKPEDQKQEDTQRHEQDPVQQVASAECEEKTSMTFPDLPPGESNSNNHGNKTYISKQEDQGEQSPEDDEDSEKPAREVEAVDASALESAQHHPTQGAFSGTSSDAKKDGGDALMPNVTPATAKHPSQPQINLEPRTHPLGSEGTEWKGVPLEESHQRHLDMNEEEAFNIGAENIRHEKAVEVKLQDGVEEMAAQGVMPSVKSSNEKVKKGNKIKGELKYLSGKLTGNSEKMQEGKKLKGEKEFEQ